MGRVETRYRCKVCKEEFLAVSGTRTSCSCGMCKDLEPRKYSTSYDGKQGMNFETLDSKIFYNEEDYTILSGELLELWEEIKGLKKKDDYSSPYTYVYEMKDKSADGKEFISMIIAEFSKVSKYDEQSNVRFECELDRKDVDEEKLKEKMVRFIGLYNKTRNNEVDICNEKYMDELCKYHQKTQQEKYDHTYYL